MAGSKKKQYLIIFVWLTVLTGLELGVVYMDVGKTALLVSLVGLALAKATLVGLYFMHLKEETKWLKWTVGIPLLVFPPIYAIVLIFEAAYRLA